MRPTRSAVVALIASAVALGAASSASAQVISLPNTPPVVVIPIPPLPGLPPLLTDLLGGVNPTAPVQVTPGGPPTLQLSADQDPIEDNAFPFAVVFTRTEAQPPTQRVIVTVKPMAEGVTCAPRASEDQGREVLDIPTPGDSDRIIDNSILVTDPGTYLVCGWLQDPPDGSPAIAVDAGTFAAREPRSTIAVGAPASVALAEGIPVSLAGKAEVGRSGTVLMRPQASGAPTCAATAAGERAAGAGPVLQGTLAGEQTLTSLAAPRAVSGTYLLCGYVGEGFDDPAPESRSSATTQVIGPPPACFASRATLAQLETDAASSAASVALRARIVTSARERVTVATRRAARTTGRKAKRIAQARARAQQAFLTEQTARATQATRLSTTTQASLVAARAVVARACA